MKRHNESEKGSFTSLRVSLGGYGGRGEQGRGRRGSGRGRREAEGVKGRQEGKDGGGDTDKCRRGEMQRAGEKA